jgi:hypothetical protein
MRNPFPSPPAPAALATLEVHEWIREYPELLPLLRKIGVDPREEGAAVLSPPARTEVRSELWKYLAWRVGRGG